MPFDRTVSGDWIVGTDRFRLGDPLSYYSPRLGKVFTAPFDFDTDFSSIPPIAWTILKLTPTSHKVRRAGVIHDYLYRTGIVSRAVADQLFYDMIREEGLGYVRGQLCWQALRVFGGVNYKGAQDGK